jgi:hypothetical protein
VLTGEKAATEFLDVVREELAGVDSRLQPSTSGHQASTSRHRFVTSHAARVTSRLLLATSHPFSLELPQWLVGFDLEGWTWGSDLTVWAGLGNEADMFFPESGRNERQFCCVAGLETERWNPLGLSPFRKKRTRPKQCSSPMAGT